MIVPLLVAAFGVVIERLLLRRLYGVDHLYGLLLTFGLALVLEGAFQYWYGTSGLPYATPPQLAGGANLGKSLQAVAVQGRISVIGVLEGGEISAPAPFVLLKSPVIQGIGVGHRRALEDLVGAIDRTGIKPVIDARYRFAELREALAHLDRGPFGKVVVEF